ncbi:MAG: AAA family ATPase [Alphaproteobacteria bacterium]|nr:AAA family ATPase [Alphaproteobacteria bacterium]
MRELGKKIGQKLLNPLLKKGANLVTVLYGPPGVGKTPLAEEIEGASKSFCSRLRCKDLGSPNNRYYEMEKTTEKSMLDVFEHAQINHAAQADFFIVISDPNYVPSRGGASQTYYFDDCISHHFGFYYYGLGGATEIVKRGVGLLELAKKDPECSIPFEQGVHVVRIVSSKELEKELLAFKDEIGADGRFPNPIQKKDRELLCEPGRPCTAITQTTPLSGSGNCKSFP